MLSLFPIEYMFPPGFIYEENFLTHEEEKKLLELISTIELHNMIFQGFEAKRKTPFRLRHLPPHSGGREKDDAFRVLSSLVPRPSSLVPSP